MFIERLQVEEGFLRGLDLSFVPGLNVLVGARGTGKTSVIELIRFALGAPAFTDDASAKGEAQALSVLQGGRVVVTLNDNGNRIVVERDALPRTSTEDPLHIACTVLAQNEIEAVGAQRLGRLHLVDRFRTNRSDHEATIQRLRREVGSLTAEISSLVAEGLAMAQEVQSVGDVTTQLHAALAEQQAILGTVSATHTDQAELAALQAGNAALSVRSAVYARTNDSLASYLTTLRALTDPASLAENWPSEAGGDDLLAPVRAELVAAAGSIVDASARIGAAFTTVAALRQDVERQQSELNSRGRELRQRLETLQAGASEITRKVAALQERVGQLTAMQAVLTDRRTRFQQVQARRDAAYGLLEEARRTVFGERAKIAESLNALLGPAISVEITMSGGMDHYVSAIIAALRGSGLHYNTLAPLLAESMSPLELVRAAEGSDLAGICAAAGVQPDRALAIVSAIRVNGAAEISSAPIDDAVTLRLLDGAEYKESDRLSIGQRCTVVLPILLSKHGDPLLVDQPEDHLDNAFVASTLVRSLQSRDEGDQFIFASHNANIPVLGEADRVIVMESDGSRGFVVHQGALDDDDSVAHVTRIMEGGAEAFEKRAHFYRRLS